VGYMALEDFRTEVQSALGNRGIANGRLDRWVNFSYLDITGSVDFEILDGSTTPVVAQNTNSTPVPVGAMVISLVRDTTNNNLLQWTPKTEFYRRSAAATGAPTVWARQEGTIYIHPTPTVATTLFIVHKKAPALLSGAADKAILPDTWDAAIFLLAASYGLSGLGEDERAIAWFQRAQAYIQTRMNEENLHGTRGLEYTAPTPVGARQGV
jgi:hypothetical protein